MKASVRVIRDRFPIKWGNLRSIVLTRRYLSALARHRCRGSTRRRYRVHGFDQTVVRKRLKKLGGKLKGRRLKLARKDITIAPSEDSMRCYLAFGGLRLLLQDNESEPRASRQGQYANRVEAHWVCYRLNWQFVLRWNTLRRTTIVEQGQKKCM